VVLWEGSETLDGADAKVNNDGVRVLLGEVTEAAKHLRHDLAIRGLRGVVLQGPSILGILDGLGVSILHLGVFVLLVLVGVILLVLVILVVVIVA
jgi:hypothetical protein